MGFNRKRTHNTTVNNTDINVDNSTLGVQNGIGVRGENNTVNVMDGGAFDFAESTVNSFSETTDRIVARAFDSNDSALGKSFGFAGSIVTELSNTNQHALNAVSQANRNYATDLKDFAESQSTNNDERLLAIGKWGLGALIIIVIARQWGKKGKR